MDYRVTNAWASPSMKNYIAACNAAITALNTKQAANAAELVAIQTAAKAAATTTNGAELQSRHEKLQAAETDAQLDELRILDQLQALDVQDALDATAAGYESAGAPAYYNTAAADRRSTLESAIDSEFA